MAPRKDNTHVTQNEFTMLYDIVKSLLRKMFRIEILLWTSIATGLLYLLIPRT